MTWASLAVHEPGGPRDSQPPSLIVIVTVTGSPSSSSIVPSTSSVASPPANPAFVGLLKRSSTVRSPSVSSLPDTSTSTVCSVAPAAKVNVPAVTV